MNYDILIQDDYLKNPDKFREIGLSKNNYRIDNEISGSGFGWRGQRTLPLKPFENQVCPCCNQTVDSYSNTDKLLIRESKKIFDICNKFFNIELNSSEKMTITTYFHITTEKTKDAFPNFWQDKFHGDPPNTVAGIVYLNPEAPLESGTSIMDGKNNRFVNIENKYNRLVAYDGERIHALSNTFGDSKETGRMTFTFFIHPLSKSAWFD